MATTSTKLDASGASTQPDFSVILGKVQKRGLSFNPQLKIVDFGNSSTFAIPQSDSPPVIVILTMEEREALRLVMQEIDAGQIFDDFAFGREIEFEEFCQRMLILIERLAQNGMIALKGNPFRQAPKERRLSFISQAVRNPFYIKIPLLNPDKLLDHLFPIFGWIFFPQAIVLALFGVTLALYGFFNSDFKLEKEGGLYQEFLNLSTTWKIMLILLICKIPHEFGHGLAMKFIGRKVHEMGMIILVLSPCLYCGVEEVQLEKSKWNRILVTLAGAYVDLLVTAFAAVLFMLSPPGEVANLARLTVYANIGWTMFMNMVPLTRFDGHYFLAYLWGRQSLGREARAYVRRWLSFFLLNTDPWSKEDFRNDRYALGLFGVASFLYRWFLVYSITIFCFYLGVPYGLQGLTGLFGFLVMIGANHSMLVAWDSVKEVLKEEK